MRTHRVEPGECIASISHHYGLFWDTVWSHPANAELKRLRGNPNILVPGDVVAVPELRAGDVLCATGQQHSFRKRGVPAKLSLRVLEGGEPRANEPFALEVDGRQLRGTTGADGEISIYVPPEARSATLVVGTGEDESTWPLRLHRLEPITEVSGARQRLSNLGFGVGGEQGALGPATAAAISAFQRALSLPLTGQLDAATIDAIAAAHGA